MTFKRDLDRAKLSHRCKYVGYRSLSSKVNYQT